MWQVLTYSWPTPPFWFEAALSMVVPWRRIHQPNTARDAVLKTKDAEEAGHVSKGLFQIATCT